MRWLNRLFLNNEGPLPENLGLLQVEALLRLVHSPETNFSGGGNINPAEGNRLLLDVE